MNVPLFIARRYLFARKSHNVINIISAISATGMAIGAAALILILSIYNGFGDLVKDSVSEKGADLAVVPAKGKVFVPEGEAFDALLADSRIESVCSVLEDNVFVTYDSRQGIARAKGVDSVFEEESPLREKITDGEFLLHRGFMPTAVVGADLAASMEINPRFVSRLELYYPDREKNISLANPAASVGTIALRPTGVVSVNYRRDAGLILIPIESMRELTGYGKEVSSVEISLKAPYSGKGLRKTKKDIQASLGEDLRVLDRIQQHASLYKMMEYEKAAIFFILIFIIIIISFNIFGSLTMLMIEKKEDIGTLRSLGASPGMIRKVFVFEGWMVSLLGLAVGLAVGVGLALAQQKFGMVKMPGSFFTESYPVALKWTDLVLTAAIVALIGYFIALLPASRIPSGEE